jgi:hypothetical protein
VHLQRISNFVAFLAAFIPLLLVVSFGLIIAGFILGFFFRPLPVFQEPLPSYTPNIQYAPEDQGKG